MGISVAVRKTFRSLFSPDEKNGSFRLPKFLEIGLGIVVFLELLAPFVSMSYGLDGMRHLNWISQFINIVSEGELIPRWISNGFFGFGADSFYFYPPLTFYTAVIVSSITSIMSATVLFQAISLLGTVGSFFGARALLRSIGCDKYRSSLGAIIYTFAPFRIVELYHRGALPTHLAYVFIPLVWLGLVAIVGRKEGITGDASRSGRIIFLGVSSALLALTSVPVTVVTAICIGVSSIIVWRELRWNTLLDVGLAGCLAAALTAFHFASVIAARPYTRLDEIVMLHPNLVWSQLLNGINWLYVYHLVFVYVPVAIIAFAYWKIRRSGKDESRSEIVASRIGLGLLFIVVFLDVPPLSQTFWNEFLPLQLIQFDMRFYSHLLLFVSVIAGLARSVVMKRAAIAGVWVITLGALAPAILVVFNLHLYRHLTGPAEDAPEYRPIYTASIDSFWQTISRHEADPPVTITNSQLGDVIRQRAKSPAIEEFEVTLNDSRTVIFHRFFWPYWHLYSSGKEIISHPDSIGRAIATLPQGHYNIRWQLEKTPLERAGLWISGFAWCGLLAMSGVSLVRHNVRKRRPTI